jgi:hypothetical protein
MHRFALFVHAGFDLIDHIGTDQLFAMRIAQVIGGAPDDLGGVLGLGVPGAAWNQGATFERFHDHAPSLVAGDQAMKMRQGRGRDFREDTRSIAFKDSSNIYECAA